jgi:hypothetical protein
MHRGPSRRGRSKGGGVEEGKIRGDRVGVDVEGPESEGLKQGGGVGWGESA